MYRECCSTNNVWYWMYEDGNPYIPKIPNKDLELEQEDFINLRKKLL